MRIDFYRKEGSKTLLWDLTHNGYSYLTGEKSVLYEESTLRDSGLYVNPTAVQENEKAFPIYSSRKTILYWMITSGFFSPMQSLLLLVIGTPTLIKKFAFSRPNIFSGSLSAFMRQNRDRLDAYIDRCQAVDHQEAALTELNKKNTAALDA